MWKRVGRAGLVGLTLGYGAYAAVLWGLQDRMIFPPTSLTRAHFDAVAVERGLETFELPTADGTRLYGWHRRGAGKQAVLFLRGNGAGWHAMPWIARTLPADIDVLTVSYRGYPGSEGAPSEAGLAQDARALWDKITVEMGIAPENIVVHGRSMGGGVALHLLEHAHPAALILESTFLGIDRLAAEKVLLAPTFLLNHPFRSEDRAPNVRVPTLVLHGAQDALIPVAHGRALAKLVPNATYLEVPGAGHRDLLPEVPSITPAWRSFVLAALAR